MFIDPLESRQMFANEIVPSSVGAKLSRMGTLFITGTSVRDTISVKSVSEKSGIGKTSTNGLYVLVTITSKYADSNVTVVGSFPQSSVKRIDISTGGGNDNVGANTGIKGRTVIHGGKGNDRLETHGKSGSLFGDSGDDVLTSNTPVSSVNYDPDGSGIDPDQSAERAVPLSYNFLSGGDGNDTFRTRSGDDSILGGAGNDRYEPLEAGIVTVNGTTLPNVNYASGTVFATARVAIDSVEVLAPEPTDQADVKVYLVGG